MPLYEVTTREKYVHITSYVVTADSHADAERMVRQGMAGNYEQTEIDDDDPKGEFVEVVETNQIGD